MSWQEDHLSRAAHKAGVDVEDLTPPVERDIVVRRLRLHYLDWGLPSTAKATLLFVHGGGLTAHTWDIVCLALRHSYHCIAVDLRGHGDSEWSPNMEYNLSAFADDIEGFARAVISDHFAVIGMSLGGLAALAYAATRPQRLVALVLVDVGPTVQPTGAARIRRFMELPDELDSVDDFVARAKQFNPLREEQLLRRSLLHNLRRLPNGKWTWKYDRRHRQRADLTTVDARREGLWSDVARVDCPTLVVRGGRSDVFTDEHAQELAQRLPHGEWVKVPAAGHTVQGDDPQGLLGELVPFLERVTSTASSGR